MQNIYLDNNATTCVAPEVVAAMEPFFTKLWGNPSSMHLFGGQVKKYIDQARAQVAAVIGAKPHEIIFTSCGSESNNMALRGLAAASPVQPPHIITSRVEHPAVLGVCRYLHTKGSQLTEIPVDGQGHLDMSALDDALAQAGRGAIVSIMWANNETGVIFPIEDIAQRVKSAGGIFHTDAVQAVGKVPVDVRKIPIDLLSLSGHKLHCPKGIGALYIREGTRLDPLIIGGHQEEGKRAGTENVPYIVGLGVACDLVAGYMEDEQTRVAALRDDLERRLLASCPDARVNGDPAQRLPNTTNISFEFVEGEAILLRMDQFGIAASSGSACTSGSLEPSHVIRAMGIPFTAAHGSIRFSLSHYNTAADIETVVSHLPKIISDLRELSPFVKK